MRERERHSCITPCLFSPWLSHHLFVSPLCPSHHLTVSPLSASNYLSVSRFSACLTTCQSQPPSSAHLTTCLSLSSLCLPHHLSISFLSSCLNTCLFLFQDPSIRGIFHFSAKEQMTKYEMAIAIAQAFNLPSNHLIPVNGH